MKHLSVLSLTFFLSICLNATCIVIIRTDNLITVAADSKRNVLGVNEKGETVDSIDNGYCKIHKGGKIYFAIAGYFDDIYLKYASSLTKKYTNIDTISYYFSRFVNTELQSTVEYIRTKVPRKYKEYFEYNLLVGSTAFFTIKNGKPYLIIVNFTLQYNPDIPVIIKPNFEVNRIVTYMGVYDHLALFNTYQVEAIFKNKTMAEGMKDLIRYEIKKHPDWIGEPIDVLELSSKGEIWISRKKNCK